jgi:hypothetical protein
MLTSTKTIAMNEDILLHWIERGIFVFTALNEPKIWNVKAVYLQYVSLVWQINTLRWAGPRVRWAELRMGSFWAGGISSFYHLLRRQQKTLTFPPINQYQILFCLCLIWNLNKFFYIYKFPLLVKTCVGKCVQVLTLSNINWPVTAVQEDCSKNNNVERTYNNQLKRDI